MEIQSQRKHIVIVDDNPVNLDLAETVLREHYKVTKLISGEQLLKLLARVRPDMILLDIQMPGMDGYETLIRVRAHPENSTIPVIFITGQRDTGSEREGFRLGAQDFIAKPFDNEVMLARIRSQMELYEYRSKLENVIGDKMREIEDLYHVITISWAEMVESRDGTTGDHVRNTSRYFETLLRLLADDPRYAGEFPTDSLGDLIRASIMHDIGKIGISDQVLKKPGPLTAEEFECMKFHSRIGADMIDKIIASAGAGGIAFLRYAREMALYHHERWDGTGYPTGLAGEDIPAYVRVLSVADVYDALTSVRPYKAAFTHEKALEIMGADRGRFFCPEIFDVFLGHEAVFRRLLENKQRPDDKRPQEL